MQTHIGMHKEIDRWIVAESGTGASKLQEVQEAMSCWNVAEHSGAASSHQDAEANASWKDVERVRSKKGLKKMHRGMQRAIDNLKSKNKSVKKRKKQRNVIVFG